jgi:hypothetical protein
MLAFSQSRRLTPAVQNTFSPFGPRIQEQDVLQDDLWRVQASDLVWVRSTRCVGTQRHPRGESVPHVEDRSGLSQASRGGDLDTYRSAGCSRFKSGSAVRHFIEWRNRPARPCTCRPSRTAVLHDRPRLVPSKFSSTHGIHDDASSCTAPRGGDCWLRDCVPSCPRLSMHKRRLFTLSSGVLPSGVHCHREIGCTTNFEYK